MKDILRNTALKLSYDGTNYHGWQSQKEDVNVCDTLRKAVYDLTGERVKILGCGRTDAGVHAEYYVANFRSQAKIPAKSIPVALNAHLPDDISCLAALDVPEDFHAINSCIKKEYTYRIYCDPLRSPFHRDRAWHYPHGLDMEKVRQGAKRLVGRQDFAAMKTNVRSLLDVPRSTVRTVHYVDASEKDGIIEIKVCADGFLYNMVRTIVGTLVYVSEGKIKSEDIPLILENGDRTRAGPTAPACGLYMTRVWYGGGVEF